MEDNENNSSNKKENNNYFKLMLDDLRRIFNSLDIGQKFGLITLIGITIVAGTYFIIKSTEPNWMVLYSDLSEQDSISVVEGLKKGGYPYKISKDKAAILVPANMQDELRVYVAENDLIQDSTPGFELLDGMQLGSTDFKNELTKQRIYQGELTRSIEKMSGIKKARVQLAQPERSVFTDNDEIPSASVMLILDPGYRLKAAQVKAIKNLVAYSVPRLKPEMVFITDQNGNNLTDEPGKNSSDIESFRYNFEHQTSKKVQSVLEKIVGRGNITVQVSADIDFNSTRATIESYIPVNGESSQGVLTARQTESEIYEKPIVENNVQTNSNNISPIEDQDNSNITGNQVTGSNTGTEGNQQLEKQENQAKNLNYQKQRSSASYSVSKEIKQIVYAPGTVKRMTIAVAVNKILTEEEKSEIKNLVLSASGADEARGDVISISSLQFLALDEEQQREAKLQKDIKNDTIMYLVLNKVAPMMIVLILGLAALFIFRSLINRLAPKQQAQAPAVWDEYEEGEYQHSLQDNLAGMEDALQLETTLDSEMDKKKNDLTDKILIDPAEATRVLVSYIKD